MFVYQCLFVPSENKCDKLFKLIYTFPNSKVCHYNIYTIILNITIKLSKNVSVLHSTF